MKTRIRNCELCGGTIGPVFYVVKLAQALVNYAAVNRHAGMTQMMQGNAALAEVFSSDRTLEILFQGEDANKWPEVTICQDCCLNNPVLLNILGKEEEQAANEHKS